MRRIGRVRVTLGFGIHHNVHVALLPARHLFRHMPPGHAKAKLRQHALQPRRLCGRGGKFDEFQRLHLGAGGQVGQGGRQRRVFAPQSVLQVDQAAMPVLRHQSRVAAAKLVIENLKAQRPGIACRHHGAQKAHHIQIAFARHVAEVARPIQQVHRDQRRIRQLHEKDLVARNAPDRIRINAAPEGMKTIQNNPNIGVIGAPHHLPRIAVIVDMAAPSQRLKPNPQAAFRRTLAEFAQVIRRAVDATQCLRMHRGTHQHKVGAQLLHEVKFALRPRESPRPERLRQPLKIAERLEQRDVQPMIAHHLPHIARTAVKGDEILLEYLDSIEPRRRNRRQLFPKIARDRDGGNRGFHGRHPSGTVR
ncbi:hypothetical protein GALL_482380 [mine drainage metagenome]|uniref:Uncharacterized protein n=1 Tax=mine drainage metagenome TaxID=410659 RepID=A0A1J5PEU9_9ZZZZ